MKMKILSSLLTACLLALGSAYGDVVYDNGAPNQQSGNEMTHWLQAENFQLSNPASIASAQFWTFELPQAWDGNLQWWIFNDAGGTPGSIVNSGIGMNVTKVATGLTPLGSYTEFEYNFTLNTSVLAAGTDYWFGLHLSGDYSQRHEIYWETTGLNPPSGSESIEGTMDNWSDNGQEHAFNLSAPTAGTHGSVPDASSTGLLLGVALAGLIGISRRRKA